MATDQPLSRADKEAIGLLSIGTFLEYFDMMLYVHMGILLNSLFFPKTDPRTAALLSAFAFCSTYVFRPVGALIFGYIGDHIGRKCTVVITTLMMALSCLVMAILPTYEHIGIMASIGMILCRILQSLAATGELMGAEIYLTELLKPPKSYMVVSWITETCLLGGSTALIVGIIVLKLQVSWRVIFLIGSIVALVGTGARTRLKETVDFADLNRRMKKAKEVAEYGGLEQVVNRVSYAKSMSSTKVNWRTSLAYFLIYSGGPMCFYISYIYGGELLKNQFGYAVEEVMWHNLKLQMLGFIAGITLIVLCKYVRPLVLIKYRAIIFLLLLPLASVTIGFTDNIYLFGTLQGLIVLFSLGQLPAGPILFQHFPVFKRFTYSSLLYSLSRAVMYFGSSVGLVYLVNYFNKFGILLLGLPLAISFLWGVNHFAKLEHEQQQFLKKYY